MFARRSILPHAARLRANGLLDMMYTPEDLSYELGIEKWEIRQKLLPAGLPHQKDKTGHVWIHGLEARMWIRALGQGKHQALAAGEAYCMKCRKVVTMENPKRVKHGKMTVLTGACSVCG